MKLKPVKTTLVYTVALILLLGAATLVLFQALAITVEANVDFQPGKVDLGAPSPKEFQVTLWFSGKYRDYNVSNIDTRTIRVGPTDMVFLEIKGGWKNTKIVDGKLVFWVVGPALVDLIWAKIYHMGILEPNPNRPYKIPIMVTGQFYDGTLFEGTYYMRVLIPSNPAPPPPPPPPTPG